MHDLTQLAADAATVKDWCDNDPEDVGMMEPAGRIAAFVASITDTTPIDPEWLEPLCFHVSDLRQTWNVYNDPTSSNKDVWLVRMSNGFSLKLGGTVICEKARRCDLMRLLLLLGLDATLPQPEHEKGE